LDRAAQAQGRGALRLHRPGEEEPIVPAPHPFLAALRARGAGAAARAGRGARDPPAPRPGAAGVIAVVPFVADEADPDAADLARWIASETAAQLPDGRLVLAEVAPE